MTIHQYLRCVGAQLAGLGPVATRSLVEFASTCATPPRTTWDRVGLAAVRVAGNLWALIADRSAGPGSASRC